MVIKKVMNEKRETVTTRLAPPRSYNP